MSRNISLPAPVRLTPIEAAHIEEEPVKLFPVNQDSVFGQVRKVFCDQLQIVSDQLETLFSEHWPASSNIYLNYHEFQMGVPQFSSGSLGIRRALVEIQYLRGPFTPALRNKVIEFFIGLQISPGVPVTFRNVGVPIGPGLPLYSGISGPLTSFYSVSESRNTFSYTVLVDPIVGVDVLGLTRELTRITPAGITFQVLSRRYAGIVTATSTVTGRFGRGQISIAGRVTAASTVSGVFSRRIGSGNIRAQSTVVGGLGGGSGNVFFFTGASPEVGAVERPLAATNINATSTVSGRISGRRNLIPTTTVRATSTVVGSISGGSGNVYSYHGATPDVGAVEYPSVSSGPGIKGIFPTIISATSTVTGSVSGSSTISFTYHGANPDIGSVEHP